MTGNAVRGAMLRLLRGCTVALALAAAGCGGGTTAEGCPRAPLGDWTCERASAPEFALTLCIPPGYRRLGELAWGRRSSGAMILVIEQPGHIGEVGERRTVLSPCRELGVGCAIDSADVTQVRRSVRRLDGRLAVLETARMPGGDPGAPRVSAALLRIEVGADQWAVVRGVHPDSTRLPELVRALESVRLERVGRAVAPAPAASAPGP